MSRLMCCPIHLMHLTKPPYFIVDPEHLIPAIPIKEIPLGKTHNLKEDTCFPQHSSNLLSIQ